MTPENRKRAIQEMLALQDGMNLMVNADWINAGYAWHRAAYVEAVELLEHLGAWKWWKAPKKDVDIAQLKLELVDIWHFALSWALVKHGNETALILDEMVANWGPGIQGSDAPECSEYDPEKWVEVHGSVDNFIETCGRGEMDFRSFFRLCAAFGLSFEDLAISYVSKNALNRFRQSKGYKDGWYVKTWGGQEDNEVLDQIVIAMRTSGLEVTLNAVMASLERAYAVAIKGYHVAEMPMGSGRAHLVPPGSEGLPEYAQTEMPLALFAGKFR